MSEEETPAPGLPRGPLPWHQEAWRALQEAGRQDRLPHALLITGPGGVGKNHFAEQFAQSRLCHQPDADGIACGECDTCRQFTAGSHPDWRRLGIEGKRKTIVIDQIRGVIEWLGLTASDARGKHLMIEPAERMTVGASNSLLKTLEEPSGDTVIMLVSRLPGRLSATIRSRCRQLALPRPDRNAALAWLEQQSEKADWPALLDLADGSPLRARTLAEAGGLEQATDHASQALAVAQGQASLVEVADKWSRQSLPELLDWFRVWLESLARRAQGGEQHEAELLRSHSDDLQKLLRGIDWKSLHELLMEVQRAEQRMDSANPQLLLETLLGQWKGVFGQGKNTGLERGRP
jgi:DNA polymerase-3 subunit delta'